MFNLYPQQNLADMLKATAYRGTTPDERQRTLTAIKRLETARTWQPVLFGQAIEGVRPGAIWTDADNRVHIDGGVSTLERIVEKYCELAGEPLREVI
jgi:hypothetical protein